MLNYIALGNDNKPLLNGKIKTIKQWKNYGKKINTLKKFNFDVFASVIPTWISGRDFEYVRISFGKIC